MRFIKYTLTTAESDSANSLSGIYDYANEDVSYVQDSNHYFRFFAADTTAPDGRLVIAPDDITPPAPGRWLRQGPPGPAIPDPGRPAALSKAADNSYDFYIENRTDLARVAPPVGGVFTLPGGAWLFTGLVQLLANERVVLADSGVLYGQQPTDGIVGDIAASPLITSTAGREVTLDQMTFYNPSGPAFLNNASVLARRSTIVTDAASIALECLLGNWEGEYNDIISNGVSFAVRHWIGNYLDYGSNHEAGATCIDNRDTAGLIRLDSAMVIGGQNGMRFRSTRGEINSTTISMGVDTAACIAVINGAQDLVIRGGALITPAAGTDRSGIWFTTGDAGEKVQISDTVFRNVNRGIRNTAPVVGNTFQMVNTHMGVDVPVGIAWPNGFIPTNGMALSNCAFLGATPFDGFDENSAGVNIKGCLGAGGPLPESPIVL